MAKVSLRYVIAREAALKALHKRDGHARVGNGVTESKAVADHKGTTGSVLSVIHYVFGCSMTMTVVVIRLICNFLAFLWRGCSHSATEVELEVEGGQAEPLIKGTKKTRRKAKDKKSRKMGQTKDGAQKPKIDSQDSSEETNNSPPRSVSRVALTIPATAAEVVREEGEGLWTVVEPKKKSRIASQERLVEDETDRKQVEEEQATEDEHMSASSPQHSTEAVHPPSTQTDLVLPVKKAEKEVWTVVQPKKKRKTTSSQQLVATPSVDIQADIHQELEVGLTTVESTPTESHSGCPTMPSIVAEEVEWTFDDDAVNCDGKPPKKYVPYGARVQRPMTVSVPAIDTAAIDGATARVEAAAIVDTAVPVEAVVPAEAVLPMEAVVPAREEAIWITVQPRKKENGRKVASLQDPASTSDNPTEQNANIIDATATATKSRSSSDAPSPVVDEQDAASTGSNSDSSQLITPIDDSCECPEKPTQANELDLDQVQISHAVVTFGENVAEQDEKAPSALFNAVMRDLALQQPPNYGTIEPVKTAKTAIDLTKVLVAIPLEFYRKKEIAVKAEVPVRQQEAVEEEASIARHAEESEEPDEDDSGERTDNEQSAYSIYRGRRRSL